MTCEDYAVAMYVCMYFLRMYAYSSIERITK